MVNIMKSPHHKLKERVKLAFQITQHIRDKPLMQFLIIYFNCGNIYKKKEAIYFIVTKLSDIENKIITFFNKYPIIGTKSKDFDDWCKVAKMVKEGKHLTPEGLDQIRKIKAGMNTGRI